MKKKLTNERIVNIINLLGRLNDTPLPIKVAYAVSKNIDKIERELKAYNIERSKLLDKYTEKDEKGEVIIENGHFKIKEECAANWNREIRELLDIENDVEIHMIQLDDLLNSNCSIAPSEFELIDFMIKE
ncbi:hypothetical protein [uncultured Clostridium sp.]|uniref:hypothetical protein n=1 Tax=uncultured Clostridium sp. TaxID=59620 RepID=UPI0026284BA9|nr:hypothetical protein [uncultured Clostridium sp.]